MAQKVFKQKRTTFIYWLLFTKVISAWSCSFRSLPANWESPGRLDANKIEDAYGPYSQLCKGASNGINCEKLNYDHEGAERIGHVLGAYQEYTMKLTEKGPLPHGNAELQRDAVSLMETAFSKWKLDAVELDVHVEREAKNRGRVFTLHYEPAWDRLNSWPKSQMFIDNPRNTLGLLLDHFFSRYAGTKHLYVELKAPMKCRNNGTSPNDSCKIVTNGVAEVLKERSDALKAHKGAVAVGSFSTQMLRAIYTALLNDKLHDTIDYILILGPTNRISAIIGSIFKGWIPKFGKEETEWLVRTPWLVGIWYSPKVINDLPTQIAKINRRRNLLKSQCLFVGISTYQQHWEDFQKSVRESWSNIPNNLPTCGLNKKKTPAIVRSFIFDIDSQYKR